jgi:hypothetical protein
MVFYNVIPVFKFMVETRAYASQTHPSLIKFIRKQRICFLFVYLYSCEASYFPRERGVGTLASPQFKDKQISYAREKSLKVL